MLARRPEGVGLAAELGLDVVHPAAGSSQLWTRGALRPLPRTLLGVPLDLDPLAASGVLSDDGLARARPRPCSRLGAGRRVGRRALGSRLGPEVVDRLAEPMLGGVYAGHADCCRRAATVPQVVEMVRTRLAAEAAARCRRRPASPPGLRRHRRRHGAAAADARWPTESTSGPRRTVRRSSARRPASG